MDGVSVIDLPPGWERRWARLRPRASDVRLAEGSGAVESVAVVPMPDGRAVVVAGTIASGGGSLGAWDLASRRQLASIPRVHRGRGWLVAVGLLAGARLVALTLDQELWDVLAGRRITPRWDSPPLDAGGVWTGTLTTLAGCRSALIASEWTQITVWDLESGRRFGAPMKAGARHRPRHIVTATLPDGRPVAISAGDDKTVRVWDLAERRQVGAPLAGHTQEVNVVAVTVLPDGRPAAVSGSQDETVRVWDLLEQRQIALLTGHAGSVTALAATTLPDGRPVAVSGSQDMTVRVWDVAGGRPLGEPWEDHAWARSIAIAALPDGARVAVTGSNDGAVRIRELVVDPDAGTAPERHLGWVSTVATGTLRGGRVAVTSGHDRTVRAWNLDTGAPAGRPLTGHRGTVGHVALGTLPDGRLLAVSACDYRLLVWDVASGALLHELTRPPRQSQRWSADCFAVAAPPGGRLLALAGGQRYDMESLGQVGAIQAWDLTTGEPIDEPRSTGTGPVTALAVATLAAGWSVVVAGDRGGRLQLWDPATGDRVGDPSPPLPGQVTAIATTTALDGRPIAVTRSVTVTADSQSEALHVVDLLDRRAMGPPLRSASGRLYSHTAGRLADGRPVAVAADDGRNLLVWDLAGHRQVAAVPLSGFVWGLAVTAEGGILAAHVNGHELVQPPGQLVPQMSAAQGRPAGHHVNRRRGMQALDG